MASTEDTKTKGGGASSTKTASPPSPPKADKVSTPKTDTITALEYLTAHAKRTPVLQSVPQRQRAAKGLSRAAKRRHGNEKLTVKQWAQLAGGAK